MSIPAIIYLIVTPYRKVVFTQLLFTRKKGLLRSPKDAYAPY